MNVHESDLHLFVALLGGRPKNATMEQHNMFFGIGPSLEFLYPAMREFWPEPGQNLHIDAWMRVDHIGEYAVAAYKLRGLSDWPSPGSAKLFFINLGGYTQGVLVENHKPLLIVASTLADAMLRAKEDPFMTEGFKGDAAKPHIDDKVCLDGFDEHDGALDVSALMEGQGYTLVLTHDGTGINPEVNLTGFLRIGEPVA